MNSFQVIDPVEYQKRHFDAGIRSDGRAFHEKRKLDIVLDPLSNDSDTVLVKLGKTCILVGTSPRVSLPDPHYPTHGFLAFDIQFPFHLSVSTDTSPIAMEYMQLFQSLFSKNEWLDRSFLVISPGEAVWTLHIHLVCLHDDGNLFEAFWIGIVSCLKKVLLPTVVFDAEKGSVTITSLPNQPLAWIVSLDDVVPFNVFLSLKRELVDPNADEEKLPGSSVRLLIRPSTGQLLYTFVLGQALPCSILSKIIQKATLLEPSSSSS